MAVDTYSVGREIADRWSVKDRAFFPYSNTNPIVSRARNAIAIQNP